jgi:hypothetical protein
MSKVWCLGLRGSEDLVEALRFRFESLGFRVQGLGFKVWG